MSEQGWTQQATATELGISQAAVSKILRRLDERAIQITATELAHLKVRRARHLEYLSREGRHGWEQSKQGRVRRRQRKAAGPDGTPVVTQEVVVDEHPDPRMLDQARKAEESLATLLGFTATASRPTSRPTDAPGPTIPPLVQLSTETLERALADLTRPPSDSHDPE